MTTIALDTLQSRLNPSWEVEPSNVEVEKRDLEKASAIVDEALLQFAARLGRADIPGATDPTLKALLPEPPKGDLGRVRSSDYVNKNLAEMVTDMFVLMAAICEAAKAMRGAARVMRNVELQGQVSSMSAAAGEMRNAAQDRFKNSILQGSFQIMGGAMGVGLGAAGGITGAKSIKVGTGSELGAKLANHSAALGGSASGTSSMLGSFGSVAGASLEQQAAMHDAERVQREMDARVHENATQVEKDMMDVMDAALRDVQQKTAAIEQNQADTGKSVARGV